MNLRKEIETLMLWYIPAIIIAVSIDLVLSAYIKESSDTSSIVVWSYMGFNLLINHLHHIVIAIWLYVIAKKMNQRHILWSLFGLVAHLFAVVTYLVLYVYEQKVSAVNNKSAV
jgi:hypothetical protein